MSLAPPRILVRSSQRPALLRVTVPFGLAILIAVVLGTIHVIAPLRLAVVFLAFTLLCTVPGIVLVRRLYGEERSWLIALLVGPIWGYALSSLGILGLWLLGVRHPLWLALVPVGLSLACLFARPMVTLERVPILTQRDLMALALLLLLVPAVVGRPYARVGERTTEGEAWRAYFTADFVWAMAVVGEVSKGDVLPHNPYRVGTSLHYYWLAHLIPSVEHRMMGSSTSLRQILLANAVLSGLAFIGFFYFFVRHFVDSAVAAALACLAAVLFHSFEGAQQLMALWRLGAPLDLVQYLNIDAVTRWIFHSMPVDGLQRLLLYQPQHQMGYVLGLLALLILVQARDSLRGGVMLLVGTLLATSLLLSTFSALMMTVMAATLQGIRLLAARRWRAIVPCAVGAALPLVCAVLLANTLQYVEHGGALVSFMVNALAFESAPLALFLSFGAMLIGAIAGAVLVVRRGRVGTFALIWTIVSVSFFFYFFVDVRDHQHVYVGWRAGHMLFIAFAPLVAFALRELWTGRPLARVTTVVVAASLVLCAAPTTAIDLYNTQDTSNRQEAPGFHWTVILSTDELEALEWIRTNTPPDAIVQVEPFLRDAETWAYIPAFAERRMAAGLPISMIPLDQYRRASHRIRDIYRSRTPEDAYLQARATGVQYLVVGPPERARYPELEATLNQAPELWTLLMRNNSVSVYKVHLQRTRS